MLKEFLRMTWGQVQDSEYQFKSNNAKHVIQLEGTEIGGPPGSLLLTYYNLHTGAPMIAVWRTEGEDVTGIEDADGFRFWREYLKDNNGDKYTETVYLEDYVGKALD